MTPFTAQEIVEIRAQFPVLSRTVQGGVPLVYLDNAATSQKPASVIEVEAAYYREMNANVHRGMHSLAEEATAAYEEARTRLAAFFGRSGSARSDLHPGKRLRRSIWWRSVGVRIICRREMRF